MTVDKEDYARNRGLYEVLFEFTNSEISYLNGSTFFIFPTKYI